MANFDEEMKKVNDWITKKGLTDFKESEILVNEMKRLDAHTLEIGAYINIYLKNDDLYSAQIKFIVKKRK